MSACLNQGEALDLSYAFGKAGRKILKDNLLPDQDYLIITPIRLLDDAVKADTNLSLVFIEPDNGPKSAAEVMNRMVSWLKDTKALDQSELYGKNWEDYNITMFRFRAGEFPSIVAEFPLVDYCFKEDDGCNASDFNALMRMLDRDRMGKAMHKALVTDFNMRMPPTLPNTWKPDLRAVSHPDAANINVALRLDKVA